MYARHWSDRANRFGIALFCWTLSISAAFGQAKPAAPDKAADPAKPAVPANKPPLTKPAPAKPAEPGAKEPVPKVARLTMKEVLQMQKNRQTPDDIVGLGLERGVEFEITKAIHSQLTKLGFSERQIEILTGAYMAEPLPPLVPGQYVGLEEPERDKLFKAMQMIAQGSLADPQFIQTKHYTLWASKDLQTLIGPDIVKIEAILETRFAEPLRSGLDRRAAHLVLVKSPQEYAAWIRKFYETFPASDNPNENEALMKLAQTSFGYLTPYVAATCSSQRVPEQLHRWVAVSIGNQYMRQLAQSKGPIAVGFGNTVERAMTGTPLFTLSKPVYGGEQKAATVDLRNWAAIVSSRAAARTLTPPSKLLTLEVNSMNLEHFAEAWSLIDLLASDRVHFGKFVNDLGPEKSPMEVIQAVYGWDEAKLVAEWTNHVAGK